MKNKRPEKDSRDFMMEESDLFRPRSIELETEFIQHLIQSCSLMKSAYGIINKDDLTEEGPYEIYKTMSKMYENNQKWNPIILKSEIKDADDHQKYFKDLPEPLEPEIFASLVKNVKTTTTRRRLHSFLYREFNSVWEKDPQEIAAESLTFFSDLDLKTGQKDSKNLKTTLKSHVELMKSRYRGETVGIATGFPDLDFLLGQGLRRREVMVPAARPGVGKSSFAVSVALNAAKLGYKVLFVTIEMDDLAIMDKLVAFETQIPLTQLLRGRAPKDKVVNGYKRLQKLPLTIRFMGNPTSAEIYSVASKQKYSTGLDLVIVDYLGIVDKDATNEDVIRLGRTMMNFKSMANMLNCAVVVPHQLSRRVENRPKDQKDPLLSDLRGSGDIENTAATVLFITRETLGDRSKMARMRLAKNRYGQTGTFDLTFNNLTTRFENK